MHCMQGTLLRSNLSIVPVRICEKFVRPLLVPVPEQIFNKEEQLSINVLVDGEATGVNDSWVDQQRSVQHCTS